MNVLSQDWKILLCDVHRERAWMLWFKAAKKNGHNLTPQQQQSVLKQLRRVASASTENEIRHELASLRDMVEYQTPAVQHYLETTWIQHKEVWNIWKGCEFKWQNVEC